MGSHDSELTIYHNPRCSKSRQTLQLLREHGVEPRIVEYLRTPPDRETLHRLLHLLGLRPRQLMRSRERLYKELGLDDPGLPDDALIDAMIAHPTLIERPIVLRGGDRAALGRPPQQVLEILE